VICCQYLAVGWSRYDILACHMICYGTSLVEHRAPKGWTYGWNYCGTLKVS